ncbi:hypothetical protein PTKIN_Ptkin04bG0134300 [Pterospermum kingtungense]
MAEWVYDGRKDKMNEIFEREKEKYIVEFQPEEMGKNCVCVDGKDQDKVQLIDKEDELILGVNSLKLKEAGVDMDENDHMGRNKRLKGGDRLSLLCGVSTADMNGCNEGERF